MRNSLVACFALILLSVAPVHAQSQGNVQQQAHAARLTEIRRQNYAKQEAVRLLFGPQGIPALTRPSDPWSYQRPRFGYGQPYINRSPYQVYYR